MCYVYMNNQEKEMEKERGEKRECVRARREREIEMKLPSRCLVHQWVALDSIWIASLIFTHGDNLNLPKYDVAEIRGG